jgi:ferredoxin-type protein NapG
MSDDGIRRRDLFRFWRRPPAPAAEPERLRPPGAIVESLFVDACQRCGRCVEVCPRQAIAPLDASFGASAGTPAIRARQAPCVVCEGLVCTTVCPSGALLPLAVFDVLMGTAEVDRARCLSFQGEACRVCVDACPVPGALAAPDGHPEVEASRCIGCGVCEHVCPTPIPSIGVRSARRVLR